MTSKPYIEVALSQEAIRIILASMNYTKNRTLGSSWEERDEKLRIKLEEALDLFPKHQLEGDWRNLIDTWG